MRKNNSQRSKRGRPEKRVEFEIELIESEESAKRWAEIFRLLEILEPERSHNASDESNGREYDQLRLL